VSDPAGTVDGQPTFKYRIKLYNKKYDDSYDKVRPYIVHYCDPLTMLSDTAIYGVVYSQTRRFAMRNAWSADFYDAMVVMTTTMLKLGYNFHKIMQQINKFVKKQPSRYGPNRMWELRNTLNSELRHRFPNETGARLT